MWILLRCRPVEDRNKWFQCRQRSVIVRNEWFQKDIPAYCRVEATGTVTATTPKNWLMVLKLYIKLYVHVWHMSGWLNGPICS